MGKTETYFKCSVRGMIYVFYVTFVLLGAIAMAPFMLIGYFGKLLGLPEMEVE